MLGQNLEIARSINKCHNNGLCWLYRYKLANSLHELQLYSKAYECFTVDCEYNMGVINLLKFHLFRKLLCV